ncbi:MAG: phosphoglycolate phosphatase [Azospirillaceae bacterium]
MAAGPRVAVLDLDGTLVDTAPDLAGALDALFAEIGLEPLGAETARGFIGHGIARLVVDGLAARGRHPDEDESDRLVTRFTAIYEARIARESRPYPGAEACLADLRAAGWRLAVCTNKAERLSRLLLSELGLAGRFTVIAGPETFGARKPDAEPLLRSIAAAGGRPESAAMVGDSEIDVATARAAGVPVAVMAHGYAKGPAEDLGADAVVAAFADLPAALDRLVAG